MATKKNLIKYYAITGGIVLAVVGFFWGLGQLKTMQDDNLPGTHIPNLGQGHVAEGTVVKYNSVPPTSGPHYANVADWGIYDHEIDDRLLVHDLEHGGIEILYNGIDDETIQKLKVVYADLQKTNGRILMAPYPGLKDAKIALTAWTWLDKLQSYDEQTIRDFFQAHVDNGPEKVPLIPMAVTVTQ